MGRRNLGALQVGYSPNFSPYAARGAFGRPMGPSPYMPGAYGGHPPGPPGSGWGALQPLGIGAVTFTASSGVILAASQTAQKLFHPQRLIIDVARTGTTATGLVTVTRIDIGADNSLATSGGTGPIPVSMFANVGVDLNVNFSVATPGVSITVQMQISLAPSSSDTVACSVGMLGSAPAMSAPQAQFGHWGR